MKSKVIRIIFVASLALNLAFFSNLIYKNFLKARGNQQTEIGFENKIKIDNEQWKVLEPIIRKFRITMIGYKNDILEKRIEIIEEFGDPVFDLVTIEEKAKELNEVESQLNMTFIATLIEINDLLSSKQRLQFLLDLSKNWFFISDKLERD